MSKVAQKLVGRLWEICQENESKGRFLTQGLCPYCKQDAFVFHCFDQNKKVDETPNNPCRHYVTALDRKEVDSGSTEEPEHDKKTDSDGLYFYWKRE